MGALVSTAKLFFYATLQLRKTFEVLKKRIETSPGLPVHNPTLPLWTVPAAQIPQEDHGELPEYADIVIVGSGITGTSFAYNALTSPGLKVVMLEARAVCSGATGRNGGHINPPLYHDYMDLKKKHGEHVAKVMVAFRRSHITEMQRIASEEDIQKQSQVRETEHLDVYTCPTVFAEAVENLAKWKAEMPLESSSFVVHEREEAIKKYHLSDDVVGCISNTGGAMHPYRFVTSLLSILLDRHPNNFRIFSHTPCTAVTTDASSSSYVIHTSRGTLRAKHVVHATNGWTAHLVRPLLTKIAPARGNMSAQRPGTALHRSTLSGFRSFVFYREGVGYDYLTQLPSGEHELMFGGGWATACDANGLPEIGIADDSVVNHVNQSYLAGALPRYFGTRNWGRDASPAPEEGEIWGEERTKAEWSGILGISADMLPWVGRLPEKVSGRAQPKTLQERDKSVRTAAPGEWVAAGYTGEGMVHAWMSGKALAYMVLDRDEETREWFPDVLRVTEKRWKEAKIEDLFARFMS
ncbi:FAD dependent oxidoreductase [Dichomitus squalens LYAD-421 SS1]|uniref:FAD dependent oxidoreductase n=1 Tax=Dichomitus squalens (strain LYAD-421) TaxID=732165 RepID=R7SV34_DICSQ|nr:FAD dependent oxidoreductase [Dichomitus squalens LYAD-421 SS1]EJF58832.1 FAD dependent oxidoreductase [Dichomitus squalens LYAD-421 SS1]